jgi:hypothetical protein
MKKEQLAKANKWLNKNRNNYVSPVVEVRSGYAQFVGYIYKIRRSDKPDVWFVVNVNNEEPSDNKIISIKRICF